MRKSFDWHFPLINPVREFPVSHFLDHIRQECNEFEWEDEAHKKDLEAVDILHSAESFVRKYFAERGVSFKKLRQEVRRKNQKRGYYTK